MLHTVVGVLSRNLGNSVANLPPDLCRRLAGQASHQFLPDDQSLLSGKSREEFLDFVRGGIFFRPGSHSAEEHCSECTRLSSFKTVRKGTH